MNNMVTYSKKDELMGAYHGGRSGIWRWIEVLLVLCWHFHKYAWKKENHPGHSAVVHVVDSYLLPSSAIRNELRAELGHYT